MIFKSWYPVKTVVTFSTEPEGICIKNNRGVELNIAWDHIEEVFVYEPPRILQGLGRLPNKQGIGNTGFQCQVIILYLRERTTGPRKVIIDANSITEWQIENFEPPSVGPGLHVLGQLRRELALHVPQGAFHDRSMLAGFFSYFVRTCFVRQVWT